MKRIIVHLEGGLGNQMFQYARARYLQEIYGGTIEFDLRAFNSKQIRAMSLYNLVLNDNCNTFNAKGLGKIPLLYFKFLRRFFSLLSDRIVDKKKELLYLSFIKLGLINQYTTRFFYSREKSIPNIVYVSGNWLSPKFFSGIENILRKEFQVKKLSDKNKNILNEIKETNSICVHIRLGDYLSPEWKDKLYVCNEDYYKEAISYIKNIIDNPVFYVFSNRHKDIEWIKENFDLGPGIIYVDQSNSDYEDMQLMYNCKHFIMSNSTYSWWAQFLSNNPSKKVVAPSRFNNVPAWDMQDIYEENWHLVKV